MDLLYLENYIRDFPMSGDIKVVKRQKRSDCPGGIGNFGFNTYNLITFMLNTPPKFLLDVYTHYFLS